MVLHRTLFHGDLYIFIMFYKKKYRYESFFTYKNTIEQSKREKREFWSILLLVIPNFSTGNQWRLAVISFLIFLLEISSSLHLLSVNSSQMCSDQGIPLFPSSSVPALFNPSSSRRAFCCCSVWCPSASTTCFPKTPKKKIISSWGSLLVVFQPQFLPANTHTHTQKNVASVQTSPSACRSTSGL